MWKLPPLLLIAHIDESFPFDFHAKLTNSYKLVVMFRIHHRMSSSAAPQSLPPATIVTSFSKLLHHRLTMNSTPLAAFFTLIIMMMTMLNFATSQQQPQQQQCDQFPDDPLCQQQQFQRQQRVLGGGARPACNYQDLWLIPGKADASCTRPNPRKIVELNAKQVKIQPPIIKFPGCFTVEIRNVHVLQPDGLSNSIFAKTEFQWLYVRGSENAKCQNASINGCGGYGNNCYYCDICDSLKTVDQQRPEQSGLPAGIAGQLKGMNCPREPGFYTFRKQFCFNDWSLLDADGDCRLDFLSGPAEDQSGLRVAMAALQQVGYGTVVAKVRLAYNATPEIAHKKALKEAQIERMAARELMEQQQQEQQRQHGGEEHFRQWFLAERKGRWHRDEYLPWLLYENEIACIRLTFDVCERSPQERWDGTGGYTCI